MIGESAPMRAISNTGDRNGNALDALRKRFDVPKHMHLNANQLSGFAMEIELDVEKITENDQAAQRSIIDH